MGKIERARNEIIDLESTIFELGCGLNALNAIHTAMAEGPFGAETYVDALYCVYGYLAERNRTIDAAIGRAIKSPQANMEVERG